MRPRQHKLKNKSRLLRLLKFKFSEPVSELVIDLLLIVLSLRQSPSIVRNYMLGKEIINFEKMKNGMCHFVRMEVRRMEPSHCHPGKYQQHKYLYKVIMMVYSSEGA